MRVVCSKGGGSSVDGHADSVSFRIVVVVKGSAVGPRINPLVEAVSDALVEVLHKRSIATGKASDASRDWDRHTEPQTGRMTAEPPKKQAKQNIFRR